MSHDIEDINRRKEVGNRIDHMHEIGIPDRKAYEIARSEYRQLNSKILRGN